MNKKFLVGMVILIITVIVGLLAYIQIFPLIEENPSEGFVPIEISEADETVDINMALSFLYNITKEKHPTGSKEVYEVRDYIVECLNKMNVDYEIQETELNEEFWLNQKEIIYEKLVNLNEEHYQELKTKIGEKDVDEYINEIYGYSSFDEYYKETLYEGKELDDYINERYSEKIEKYDGQTLNNILVNLNSNDDNTQNILFVAHYDCVNESYGAGDDGMSVASLLETIRCLKNEKFSNNVYVLFTDGEEEGFLGAYQFIQNNDINFDLVINFDNSGSKGDLILYNYSSDNLSEQYFKAVKNEICYSFSNDIMFDSESDYFEGEISDAFAFIENDYNTIDFAMIGNSDNYHSEADSFYNIDIKSLENQVNSIIEMTKYFGNNEIEVDDTEDLTNFTLLKGVVISVNTLGYIVVAIIIIVVSFVYIVKLFKKNEKIIKKIIVILLTLISIIMLVKFQYASIMFSVPCVIMFILDNLKNNKQKIIFGVISFEIYLFVILQLIFLLIQNLIWLNWGQ